MDPVVPRLLRGFRDYLPAKMIPRSEMLRKVEATFQRFGFVPLLTPAMEYYDILGGKYGDEGEKLLYRFRDQGDRDVALRYDLTVPLARVVAQYRDLIMPFRRYQIAPVWRAERPQRGRFREFFQCDADIVGAPNMTADAELLQLACELLSELGVENYEIRLNNRKVLSGLMAQIGVARGKAENGVLQTIDKLPKVGEEKTRESLRNDNGLDDAKVQTVCDFLGIAGDSEEVLKQLRGMFSDGVGAQGVEEVTQVFDVLDAVGLKKRVTIDLSIARGLDYYTGTICEAFLTDLAGYGAVLGGGRYDGLIGTLKGEEVPAVGVSLGVDRLLEGLVELSLLEERAAVTDVLVALFEETAAYSAQVARELRTAGVGCELFPSFVKLGKQFRYADRRGQRWVVVAGADEQAAGTVTVKDLSAGTQETVALAEAVQQLSQAAPSSGGDSA